MTLELILDDYCLETYWTVKDSQDSIWYNEGPYNCNPSGGGSQANSTIIKDIYLDESECYTFELNDYYGDGLGGALWGGSDGSWTLKDLNNIIISQGQGDFGYSINQSFYVTQSIASSISTIENKNGQIYMDKYSGWYSIKDESFYHEKELKKIGEKSLKQLMVNLLSGLRKKVIFLNYQIGKKNYLISMINTLILLHLHLGIMKLKVLLDRD